MPTPLNASVLKGFEILGLLNSRQTEISTSYVADRLNLNAINKTQTPRLAAQKIRLVLQEIAEAEKSGFAVNLGDNELDIAAVSVPIRNAFGKVQ